MSSQLHNPHRSSRFIEGEPLTGYLTTTGPFFSNIILEQDLHEALRRSRQGSSSTTSSSSSMSFSASNSYPTNTSPTSYTSDYSSSHKQPRPLEFAPTSLYGHTLSRETTSAQFNTETEKRGSRNDADGEGSRASRSEKVKGRISKALTRGRESRDPAQTDEKPPRRIR